MECEPLGFFLLPFFAEDRELLLWRFVGAAAAGGAAAEGSNVASSALATQLLHRRPAARLPCCAREKASLGRSSEHCEHASVILHASSTGSAVGKGFDVPSRACAGSDASSGLNLAAVGTDELSGFLGWRAAIKPRFGLMREPAGMTSRQIGQENGVESSARISSTHCKQMSCAPSQGNKRGSCSARS